MLSLYLIGRKLNVPLSKEDVKYFNQEAAKRALRFKKVKNYPHSFNPPGATAVAAKRLAAEARERKKITKRKEKNQVNFF